MINQVKIQQYLDIANSHYLEFEYFKKNIFPVTLKLEGGDKLHKIKGDSGGYTLYGISYNKNKDLFSSFEDFIDTTYIEACAIAFVRYYLPVGADKVKKTEKLDLFDEAYNIGVVQTIKLIQQYYGLNVDGVLGKITMSKLQNITSKDIYDMRTKFYYRLVKFNSNLSKFLKGWINRSNIIFSI